MSLIVFNGSPRGKNSNSTVISTWFLSAYSGEPTVRYLNRTNQHDEYAQELLNYSEIMMVFPLYVDGMPGQVKHFFEVLSNYSDKLNTKKITYIIHSGFSQAIQNRTLESYLNRFSEIMGLNNHGIIIIPGSEGFRLMPPMMTKKKADAVSSLSSCFKNNQPYTDKEIKLLEGEGKKSILFSMVFWVMRKMSKTNSYWISQLKRNNALENAHNAPYLNSPVDIEADYYITNTLK